MRVGGFCAKPGALIEPLFRWPLLTGEAAQQWVCRSAKKTEFAGRREEDIENPQPSSKIQAAQLKPQKTYTKLASGCDLPRPRGARAAAPRVSRRGPVEPPAAPPEVSALGGYS